MTLKAYLANRAAAAKGCLSVPGVWDGLSSTLASRAGFDVQFLSGAALTMSRMGLPDLGFLDLATLVDATARIADATGAMLIVDADTGFGNAIHARRAVRSLESAGATAIQIEDQTYPKRCGHLSGKSVIPVREAAAKIEACVDARKSETTLISARTDALAIEGIHGALDRADAYLEAGADLIFVEGPRSITELAMIGDRLAARVPTIHNLVDGTGSPVSTRDELSGFGIALALHPLIILGGMVQSGTRSLQHLGETGETTSLSGTIMSLHELNEQLGLEEYDALGARYEAET
ncbi:isocitrate lyase/PEP mutase family protein [Hyphomonas johnsonii]|uniref:Isocitrate lyase family protein n=1 Tax=Hyphomonas johnsonii MHS-2 TaxID=1280950 RepID=A0A059FBB8_9PROT|nr:isocitrate lyase/phosphoenolpyruvate mutase family protein [Hyphomonas johnsonii]KCZ87909.1 isocitrate lyase family protein [Hyphomonas johnsonii MHS-2]